MNVPRTQTPPRWPAELAVAGLTAATAATFWRVFSGWDWLVPLLATAAVSHLVAWGCRRVRLPAVVAAVVSAGALVVFAGIAWYRKTTRFGIPTAGTVRSIRIDLAAFWHQFATAVSPVPGRAGFLIAAAIGMWLIAFLADSLAFRAMAGVEAVLPGSLGFALASAVGSNRMRLAATALWLLAAFVVVAVLRALRSSTTGTWLTGRARSTSNAMRWTLVAGVGATAVGVFGGASLPGVGSEALISTRNAVEGTRITVSPLVDIKGRLSKRSALEAFKVKADTTGTYWRLTVLDDFDGRRWQSTQSDYLKASSDLTSEQSSPFQTELVQDITITGLDGDFVPAAYAPTKIQSKRSVRWEPDLQSLITTKGRLKAGDHFVITSLVNSKDVTPDALRAATGAIPASISSRYLDLPSNAARSLRRVVFTQAGVINTDTAYDKARTLQDWFRANFTYSLNVPAGNGLDAIDTFLNAKQGYCEQFAGTFAAMARSIGIPSRVAVGFTSGIKQADGSFVVQGKHAHAWPEVFIAGAGWITMEPTPGRGNAEAEAITGVPAQQVDEPAGTGASATTPTSVGSQSPVSSFRPRIDTFNDPGFDLGGGTVGAGAKKGNGVPGWLVVIGGIVVGLVAALAAWIVGIGWLGRRRWARRREQATTTPVKVVLAWHQAVDALERGGHQAEPSETAKELSRRLDDVRGVATSDLKRLADLATVAGFAGIDIDPTMADEADQLSHQIRAGISETRTRDERWRLRLDPRRLWRPLPGDRSRLDIANAPRDLVDAP